MSRLITLAAVLIFSALAGSVGPQGVSVARQASDLAQQPSNPAPQPAGEWGLVLGADDTVAGALAEAKSARRTLAIEPAIFKCGSWYRTVGLFKTRSESLLYLSKARRFSRYKPYVVDMKSWCPSKRFVPTAVQMGR
jgi:hypothetical protein